MRNSTFLGFGLGILLLFSCKERNVLESSSSTVVSSEAINPRKLLSGLKETVLAKWSLQNCWTVPEGKRDPKAVIVYIPEK